MYRVLAVSLAVVAVMLFAGGAVLAADPPAKADSPAKADPNVHEGTVVSAANGKIVMTAADKTEHSHTLSADAKISVDGRDAKVDDLKPGMKIRVTTKAGDANTATQVEALDKNKDFATSNPAPAPKQ